MHFISLHLTDDGIIMATAKGHPTEVMEEFHRVSQILLASRGAWRITKVEGFAPFEMNLDSDMKWSLVSEAKNRFVAIDQNIDM